MFNYFSHLGCAITAFAATYGLLLQDVIAIAVSIVGGMVSLLVFLAGRIEARLVLREQRRRTAIIERLADRLETCAQHEEKAVLRELVELYKNET